jgi:PAS domain S-box-containing protein
VSRSSPLWPSVPGTILYYVIAVLAVAAAVIAGMLVDRFLQIAPFVSLFLCAVLVAAWLGGVGPGVLATALSILAFQYFFIPPIYSIVVGFQDLLRIALFALTAVFVVFVCAAQRRTAESLRRARDDLRASVQELQTENAERIRAEQVARQAERELQLTIDTIPAIAARYRADGSLDFVNQTWRTYTGLSQDSLWGHRWGVAIHPDDLSRVEAGWRAHLPTGEAFQLEQRMRRADGEYRRHFVLRVPHRNEKSEVTGWYGIAHDIEDQRRAEEALHRSERELRDLIETMPAIAVAALPDGSPIFANRNAPSTRCSAVKPIWPRRSGSARPGALPGRSELTRSSGRRRPIGSWEWTKRLSRPSTSSCNAFIPRTARSSGASSIAQVATRISTTSTDC